MGRPNFQRLAELGQLPEYITPSFNEALAQVDAMNKTKKAEEEKQKLINEGIENVSDEATRESLEEKSKRELIIICKEKGVEIGSKEEMINNILGPVVEKVEVKEEEEKPGEFVDPLLQ